MKDLTLVIEAISDGIECAFISQSRLEQFWRRDANCVTGGLFRARVSELDRSLDGAFLDAGQKEGPAFFIQGRDLKTGSKGKKRSIERSVQRGQTLLVQGTREAIDGKGPRVTSKVRLEGRHLVYAPMDKYHGVSPRLKGRSRDQMLERLQTLEAPGSFIARRLAADADDATLAKESGELAKYWQSLLPGNNRPSRLPSWLDPIEASIWQALDWPIERIVVSDAGLAARLRQIQDHIKQPFALERLDSDEPVFDATGVSDEIAYACARDVPLDGGGRIIIEETAACVAIDVDSGGQPAINANLAAADEIGRQCRLRNLGGTIIADFIDMPTKPQIQKLEDAIRRAFRHDHVPVQILPLSNLGIAQISRARRGGNPFARRRQACPHCNGEGQLWQ